MNDTDFKRHLKDLVRGHHHPEEHDWIEQPGATSRRTTSAKAVPAKRARRKPGKRK